MRFILLFFNVLWIPLTFAVPHHHRAQRRWGGFGGGGPGGSFGGGRGGFQGGSGYDRGNWGADYHPQEKDYGWDQDHHPSVYEAEPSGGNTENGPTTSTTAYQATSPTGSPSVTTTTTMTTPTPTTPPSVNATPSPSSSLVTPQAVTPTTPISSSQSSSLAVSQQEGDKNWAGAVVYPAPSGHSFSMVTGSFTVPAPNTSALGMVAIWIGIDGYAPLNSLVQAGIDINVTAAGVAYRAWGEWYPDKPKYGGNLSMQPGDQIKVTVQTTSSTTGSFTVLNVNNGQSYVETSLSGSEIVGQSADWMVEDPMATEPDGSESTTQQLVPFTNFGSVQFTDCSASYGTGAIGLDGAHQLTMVGGDANGQKGHVVSVSNTGVLVSYD